MNFTQRDSISRTIARWFTIPTKRTPMRMAVTSKEMLVTIVSDNHSTFARSKFISFTSGPMVANIDQSDVDRDGIGDACDPVSVSL